MTRLCVHHSDGDGVCAAAIVPDVDEYLSCNYKTDRMAVINKCGGRDVVIVDYAWDANFMSQIDSVSRSLTWIDHHERPDVVAQGWPGLWTTEGAGCENTWTYYYPDKPMPVAVQMIGRRDRWKHSEQESMWLAGLNLEDWVQNPSDPRWSELFSLDPRLAIDRYYLRGKGAYEFQMIDVLWAVRQGLYYHRKLKMYIINAHSNVSEIGSWIHQNLQKDCPTMVWRIQRDFRISMRGPHALEYAQNLWPGKGGGHKEAAGTRLGIPEGLAYLARLMKDSIRINP